MPRGFDSESRSVALGCPQPPPHRKDITFLGVSPPHRCQNGRMLPSGTLRPTKSASAAAATEIFLGLKASRHRQEARGARTDLCMAVCEVCENEYDKTFEIVVGGQRHVFDSFECAIHALAPVCPHCKCRIVGHGVEADGQIFCCVHCARLSGKTQLKDRA